MQLEALNSSESEQVSASWNALLGMAVALSGLSLSKQAEAQSIVDVPQFEFSYFGYEDWQKSGQDRVKVKTPIAWLKAPVTENLEVEASVLWDDISGASPFYLDTLSGSSGLGIEELRNAWDLRLTYYFERMSVGVGGSISREDDYNSDSGLVDLKWWTEDKNTVVQFALSPNFDRITSTNFPDLLGHRFTQNYLLGVTQNLSPISVMQTNITYSNADGFNSDQYKYLDKRPESRDQFAWLIRHNLYVEPADAALHTDYRFYIDSWDITSHTFVVAWYQPIFEHVMLRPYFRYYSQSEAKFFEDTFPPDDFEKFYSADQKVSAFGSFSFGMKVSADLFYGFSADAMYEMSEQRGEWKMGGGGTDDIQPFYYQFFGVGLSKRF